MEPRITINEIPTGIFTISVSIIFNPTNTKMNIKEKCTYLKDSNRLTTRKYMDLKPRMAKILDENTTKGDLVTDKTAGILSTAKRISVNSTMIKARNIGVAMIIPLFLIKKLLLYTSFVTGIILLNVLYKKVFFGL